MVVGMGTAMTGESRCYIKTLTNVLTDYRDLVNPTSGLSLMLRSD